ncbi:hypothetical protein MUN89_07140 [Halobacillus salinarum]|uniref:Lipoprotein n=1 Tax=Halobacillus salinarum TaxID=2932257 RepID=A0ABY4EML8_9BACI|nr:hypothetical protein [Halobacillus salinarum]UOQ45698.1 hypothetical protein MUN89_07140 [Halobacillus salinarum]
MKHLWLIGVLLVSLAACSNESADDLESSKDQSNTSEQGSSEQANDGDTKTDKQSADKQDDNQTGDSDSSNDNSSEDSDESSSDQSSDNQNSDDKSGDSEKKVDLNEGFNQYRPKQGMTKTFIQDEEYELIHEIVAANDTHIQRVVKFGDIVTLQILKWTSEGASIVYQEQNPEDTSSQLDSYETYEPPMTLVDLNEKGKGNGEKWQIVKANAKVKVPYGTFDDVYVVQQTLTGEGSGNKTVITNYYAKDLGLIKETREVKGDNGYTSLSELERVKK